MSTPDPSALSPQQERDARMAAAYAVTDAARAASTDVTRSEEGDRIRAVAETTGSPYLRLAAGYADRLAVDPHTRGTDRPAATAPADSREALRDHFAELNGR